MTSDPNAPMICSARLVAHQLRKVFNLPAHMTRFTISVDLQHTDMAQVDATFLFDQTMLKDDTDAGVRTTTEADTNAEQGKTDIATIAALVANAGPLSVPAEARDGYQVCRYGSQ